MGEHRHGGSHEDAPPPRDPVTGLREPAGQGEVADHHGTAERLTTLLLLQERDRLSTRARDLQVVLAGTHSSARRRSLAHEIDDVADRLDEVADALDVVADRRDRAAEARDTRAVGRDAFARLSPHLPAERGAGAIERHHAAVARDWAASDRQEAREDRRRAASARRDAAAARRQAALLLRSDDGGGTPEERDDGTRDARVRPVAPVDPPL
ncbi:hypothetical protein [Quadrisphaera setariae]|uniref:Uncharacterized protein n=1 Tax=Quadrisphaera setariae TaxID=2593304 RepID=A0A5C8ZF67_9ACTN|nr:hypothetical protein [Quadrisphaera setariae]TXR56124.1 hypothetical protein FMM08_11885 [Quadrisphaera setariae]